MNIANSVANHIANASQDKTRISRMVLNMKIDKNDKIWLCWCSSIRTFGDKDNSGEDPKMRMKPLNLNDAMLIPSNALNQKHVVSPKEIE